MSEIRTPAPQAEEVGYAALHAHAVRKAASREEEAGNTHLAEELRKAMQFIEMQAAVLTSVKALLSVIERHGRWIRNSLRQDEFLDLDNAALDVKNALSHTPSPQPLLSAGLSPSQAPVTGKADTGLPVNSPKE